MADLDGCMPIEIGHFHMPTTCVTLPRLSRPPVTQSIPSSLLRSPPSFRTHRGILRPTTRLRLDRECHSRRSASNHTAETATTDCSPQTSSEFTKQLLQQINMLASVVGAGVAGVTALLAYSAINDAFKEKVDREIDLQWMQASIDAMPKCHYLAYGSVSAQLHKSSSICLPRLSSPPISLGQYYLGGLLVPLVVEQQSPRVSQSHTS